MDDRFDQAEGYLLPRWDGIKRGRSEGSDGSENPAPHLARRLPDAQGMKRLLTPGSQGSGNPAPHAARCLPHEDEEQQEDVSDEEFLANVADDEFWTGLAQRS